MSDRPAIVVDGYSSGNLLAGEFKSRGHASIHVQSTPVIFPILTLTYRPDDFTHHFAFDGDLEPLVDSIGNLDPICVVAGTETGVELADALSEALGLPSNGTRMSEARRNKFLMIEAVRAHGLKAARQLRTSDVESAVAWAANMPKVVIKPVKSAGSDNVAICTTEAEIREACGRILGTVNQIGLMNDDVLCQEFLRGTEYAMDGVCLDGRAHFTALWRYHKLAANGGDFVYDHDELIPCTDETGTALCNYLRGVLEALEITQGPFHAEVMMTAEGPSLVEIGTRLNGTTTPVLHRACVGYGQLDLTADACVDRTRFAEKSAQPYTLHQNGIAISLIAHQGGTVRSVPGAEIIKKYASFNEMYLRAKPGYIMKPTIDYFTTPGFVMLVHPDREIVQRDMDALRALEHDGMYELEP